MQRTLLMLLSMCSYLRQKNLSIRMLSMPVLLLLQPEHALHVFFSLLSPPFLQMLLFFFVLFFTDNRTMI